MRRFVYSSRLEERHRDDLEGLLYFNPQQRRVHSEIEKAIETWGAPEITSSEGHIRLTLGDLPDVQCLYALDTAENETRLAGVVIYLRQDEENLVLLHMAVQEGYSTDGEHAAEQLAFSLLCRVRDAARLIRGVRQIILFYRDGLAIPVHGNRQTFLKRVGQAL